MDQYKNYSIKKFGQVHFLKKTIQILLSIYVFSMFFSHPSLLTTILNYLDHYISTFSIKLFHCNSERNYIFLLFNGILAVILKKSGLISMSPMNSSFEDSKKEKNHHSHEVSETDQVSRRSSNGILVADTIEEEIPERKSEFTERFEAEEDERQSWIVVKDGLINEPKIEEEEEEQNELMSVDELNRKCDEFIKKIREGIKFEFSTNNHSLKSQA